MLSTNQPDELAEQLKLALAEPRTVRALARALEPAHGSVPSKPAVYKWLAVLRARGVNLKEKEVREGRSGPPARAYYLEAAG